MEIQTMKILVIINLLISPGVFQFHARNHLNDLPPQNQPTTVFTPYGIIQGKETEVRGIRVRKFLGIPYAKAPMNKLRFQKPKPLKWRKSRFIDATQMAPSCPQTPYYFDKLRNNEGMRFSEDCLYLNIWSFHDSVLRPVLIFLHGGFFTHGGSESAMLDMSHLAIRGVVGVSLNYRLNAMGFLYAGVPQASGNMGLYDQQLAMQWIRKHIHYFGGDPAQITVMGQGAGATAASYHLLNPISRKLFSRMILLSGNPFAIMNLNQPTVASTRAGTIAKRLGCLSDGLDMQSNPIEVLQCISKKDANQIAQAAQLEFTRGELSLMPLLKADDFLKKSPEQLIYEKPKMDDVEILMGNAKNEFADTLYYTGYFDAGDEILPGDVKYLIGFFYGTFFRANALPIQKFYFRDETANASELIRAGGHALADGILVCPLYEFAEEMSNLGAKVYMYSFDHTSAFTKPEFGTSSSEEVIYALGSILGPLGAQLGASKKDRQFAGDILDIIATFVYYGRAYSPKMRTEWPTYSSEKPYVASLNSEITVSYATRAEECNFWGYFWDSYEAALGHNYTHVIIG